MNKANRLADLIKYEQETRAFFKSFGMEDEIIERAIAVAKKAVAVPFDAYTDSGHGARTVLTPFLQ